MLLKTICRIAIPVLAAAIGLAQSPLGTITDTVTEAQDARAPNAEVTALHFDTGISYKADPWSVVVGSWAAVPRRCA